MHSWDVWMSSCLECLQLSACLAALNVGMHARLRWMSAWITALSGHAWLHGCSECLHVCMHGCFGCLCNLFLNCLLTCMPCMLCASEYLEFLLVWMSGSSASMDVWRFCYYGCLEVLKWDGGIFLIFSIFIRRSTLLHLPPLGSTGSEDAGIELRTVATLAWTARRSNHSARSHPLEIWKFC